MEFYWFVTDKDNKVVKTGNSHDMAIRKNQDGFRKYMRYSEPSYSVHLIELISGHKSVRSLEYALSLDNETLKKEMSKEIQSQGRVKRIRI